MVEQLKKILTEIEKEINSENSIWDKGQLVYVVKPEMEKLYAILQTEKYFLNMERNKGCWNQRILLQIL